MVRNVPSAIWTRHVLGRVGGVKGKPGSALIGSPTPKVPNKV